MTQVLEGSVLHGDGPVGRRTEALLREMLGVRHAFLTTSCTHALEAAALALEIGPGDEVILPSFTFVSTANAAVLRGATPVFADVDPGTLNLDPTDVEARLTSRTRAIMPVHYAGVACDMDRINDIARRHGLRVIEDAAQGVDAAHRGTPLGAVGDVGCLSFHGTKNVVCGEGGALLTSDGALAQRMEWIREKGTNRSAFIRGDVDRYTWVSIGSSYIQSEILAAVLEVQLGKRHEIRRRRRALWEVYREALADVETRGLIQLAEIPSYADPNYHIFWFLVRDPERRDIVLDRLRDEGISATSHYVPLHTSPFGRSLRSRTEHLPVTERSARSIIRLPMWPGLEARGAEVAERVRTVLFRELGA